MYQHRCMSSIWPRRPWPGRLLSVSVALPFLFSSLCITAFLGHLNGLSATFCQFCQYTHLSRNPINSCEQTSRNLIVIGLTIEQYVMPTKMNFVGSETACSFATLAKLFKSVKWQDQSRHVILVITMPSIKKFRHGGHFGFFFVFWLFKTDLLPHQYQ